MYGNYSFSITRLLFPNDYVLYRYIFYILNVFLHAQIFFCEPHAVTSSSFSGIFPLWTYSNRSFGSRGKPIQRIRTTFEMYLRIGYFVHVYSNEY